MRLGSISLRSERSWWWVFGVLIGAPALALALLGLRVLTLERMERAQQMREQQAQLAHLADTALANMMGTLESELGRVEASPAALRDYTVFILETGGRLVFPRDKTYLPDPTRPDFRLGPQWTPNIEQMIERALAAEAQQRPSEAASLLGQIGKTESRLKTWSELESARLQFENGNQSALVALATPSWTSSDGVTPQGLPVAILIASDVEHFSSSQRARFTPLLRATLDALRAGRWWFSLEERRFYDQELRRLLEISGSPPSAGDSRLDEWPAIERIVRRDRPGADGPSDPDPAAPFLMLWSRRQDGGWSGAAIPRARVSALNAGNRTGQVAARLDF